MFGIFKKKKAFPAAVELSNEELDLIQGGQGRQGVSGGFVANPVVQQFNAQEGMAAVVGRCDLPAPKP